MRQKSGTRETTSEQVVKDIRRSTRKHHSAEEKRNAMTHIIEVVGRKIKALEEMVKDVLKAERDDKARAG